MEWAVVGFFAFYVLVLIFFDKICLLLLAGIYEIARVRRPEPLFNQTAALRRLYNFADLNRIRLVRHPEWAAHINILRFFGYHVVLVGKHIGQCRERRGIEEACFAHELGHWKIQSARGRDPCPCAHKGFHCLIEEELEAWREGLKILKELDTRVNEREYWRFAGFSLMTHIIGFSQRKCDEVFKENCPLNPAIYFSEVGPTLEYLFRNAKSPSVLRILENVYACYEAEEAIIQ